MKHILYKTVNLTNGKFYYGVHKALIKDSYMGSGKLLKEDIKKLGRNKFEFRILGEVANAAEAYDLEALVVNDELISDPNCYNMKTGGRGGRVKGYKHSLSTKLKMSNSQKGRVVSKEVRGKMSLSKKGSEGNNRKVVLDTLTGVFYSSISDAANAYGYNPKTLSAMLNEGYRLKNNTNLIKT